MSQEIVLQRGKRAGNILLIQAIVYVVFAFLEIIREEGFKDAFSELIGSGFFLIIYFAIVMFLVDGLKRDQIKRIRVFYIILASLYVLVLYSYLTDKSMDGTIGVVLSAASFVLVIIALYKFGKSGKICCYAAAGFRVLSLFFSFGSEDFSLADFASGIVTAVFFVFLGLYVESKAFYDEDAAVEPPQRMPPAPEPTRDSYEELIRLKDLMDRGVITPAEYEAKKKQILGL